MPFTEFNLDQSISKAVLACGYQTPTPIQLKSIPEIMNGNDLVACAQTGTGKTAAFVLPALHRIREVSTIRKPRVLILTPTRELAAQITQAANRYGKFLRFNMASLVGGMSYRQQLKELSRAVDVIVATPGRLLDHMENRRLDLSGIEMLILDEADRMLDMGFIDDVTEIAKATPRSKQTLLFSATVDGKLSNVIKQLLKEPIYIDLSKEKIAPAQIQQELYMADNPSHKTRLLQYFLGNEKIFKAIIFSATKIGADNLASQLSKEGFLAEPLHGDLKQSLRNKTVERLRRNKIQFLVATDVAARGIDISDVTHVINYDLPRFYEDYIHRIGRTGRAGKSGKAISFALHQDKRHIDKIERYMGQILERKVIEGLEPSQKASKEKSRPGSSRRGDSKKSWAGSSRTKENRFEGKGKFEAKGKKEWRNSSPSRDESRSDSDRRSDKKNPHKKNDWKSSAPRTEGGKKWGGKPGYSDSKESSAKKDHRQKRSWNSEAKSTDSKEFSGKSKQKRSWSSEAKSTDSREFSGKSKQKRSWGSEAKSTDSKEFSGKSKQRKFSGGAGGFKNKSKSNKKPDRYS